MKLHFILRILSAWLWMVTICSCADDVREMNVFEAGNENVVISFSVENNYQTRTDEVNHLETVVDHAYLLFYDMDSSIGENSVPVAAVRAAVSDVDPSKLLFKIPLHLEPDTDYQLLAIANADSYVPYGFSDFQTYLQSWMNSPEVIEPLCLSHPDRLQPETVKNFPMRGTIPDDSGFRFSVKDGAYRVNTSLSFRRMVARIDLTNNVSNGFVVEGVAICNWRDAVSAISDDSGMYGRAGKVCGILSEEGENTSDDIFVRMPDVGSDGFQRLKGSVYCFPSVSYNSYPSDKETTALIIKAKYKDDSESSYYRVNLGVDGNRSEVKANTKYLVNIQSVKGRGEPSAKEAYTAQESMIALSVVEDWDLEGSFAMDDNGNFIVLSTGRLEFDGEATENKEIKILASKGLTLDVRFVADNNDSADAFASTLVTDYPVSSLVISATQKNTGKDAVSGKFVVSAQTPEGGILNVNLTVVQNPSSGGSEEPTIPDDMPFALIPQSYERVKIDHVNKTIEIDGFDPDCFNSFIDIPFNVYIKDNGGNSAKVDVSSTLEWPLEGRIALNNSSSYVYCKESFNDKGSVLDGSGNSVAYTTLYNARLSVGNEEKINISVGAMGPDDPAIVRTISISNGKDTITYALTVKPRPCIIDDVILTDATGASWMIMDRNVQDLGSSWSYYIGRDDAGYKRQAYNYSHSNNFEIKIPFKRNDKGDAFSESQHTLYQGTIVLYKSRMNLSTQGNNEGIRLSWLKKYSLTDVTARPSTFYAVENLTQWILPTEGVMELIRSKIRLSKMRMFILSETLAKNGSDNLPVCCYFPYSCWELDDLTDFTCGYYSSINGNDPDRIFIMYLNNKEILKYKVSTNKTSQKGLSRLVRPLTIEELEDYKTNYLGYGSKPHRLTICHPDTYESAPFGWLEY